jgi:tetratricopeptide (TPR) repeat protein
MLSNMEITATPRNRAAAFALVVTALFVSSMAQGQSAQAEMEPSATLHGFVRDSGNRPVAGAIVCLQAKDAQTLTVHTDSAGAYRFWSLHQGVYVLRAEMAEYRDATLDPLILGEKESKTIDLTLESTKADPRAASVVPPQFFDEPHFTVAGVTDTTSLGGHGSDTIVRNREALAQATVSLTKEPPGKTAADEAGQHHLLAVANEKRGDALEAVREYQRAAELSPTESNLFDWGAELLVHRAVEPALEVFTKGNRLFPHSVRMLAGLGASWYALGSYDQAAQRLCEASDLNPDDPNPYFFMGKIQAVENNQSDAIVERLARFARLQPQNALANYYYAVSLWKRRKSPEDVENLSQVKSLLEQAVHLDPKLGPAYLQLGVLYSERKDISSATSAYQHAIDATPRLEEAHYRLAQAYRQAGESSRAQAELQLYEQITKEKSEEDDRQRHELQQFVYQLRENTPASPQ